MNIEYRTNQAVQVNQFVALLHASTLGERRPVDDLQCIRGMVENADLMISAWDGEQLVGIARSVTDFHYACYLSDLAVHVDYQRSGIGRMLLKKTREELGANCKLILLAAPAANSYYERIGFTRNPRCWVLDPDESISS